MNWSAGRKAKERRSNTRNTRIRRQRLMNLMIEDENAAYGSRQAEGKAMKRVFPRVVYKIQCPHCKVCYVGKISRHLQARFGEHLSRAGPVKAHMTECEGRFTREGVSILGAAPRSEIHLLTLEALWIRETKPYLNTQDTMKSRDLKLTIKL